MHTVKSCASCIGCADGIEEQGIQDLQIHLASVEKADTHADTIAAMAVDLQTQLLESMHSVCRWHRGAGQQHHVQSQCAQDPD